MKFVVRFAHLERSPFISVGDVVTRGNVIGRMGGSPNYNGNPYYPIHLHIDCRISEYDNGVQPQANWRLSHTPKMSTIGIESKTQLDYFIDNELFGGGKIRVTTKYNCIDYYRLHSKPHPAYDVVCDDVSKWDIFWNRSHDGEVISVGYDNPLGAGRGGYGHYAIIEFEI